MPDGTKSLPEQLAADLAAVRWPEPSEIRARARRRTRRSLVVAPTAVLVVVALVWSGSVVGHDDHGGNVATPPTTMGPAPTASPLPTFVAPGDPPWIPPEALLQPADVGAGYESTNEYTTEPGKDPGWWFNMLACPMYADVRAYRGYLYSRTRSVVGKQDGGKAVHEEVRRYAGDTAVQVVADVRRVVEACGRYTTPWEGPTPPFPAEFLHQWALTDSDFAGDESLLVRYSRVGVDPATDEDIGDPLQRTFYAVVRVGDLVAVLQTDDYDESRMRQFAKRATAWLCTAANPRC